jgi:hypothetical protein
MQVHVREEQEAPRAIERGVADAQGGEREPSRLEDERIEPEKQSLGDGGRPDEAKRSDRMVL